MEKFDPTRFNLADALKKMQKQQVVPEKKHNHKEAFCHMSYATSNDNPDKNIYVRIWNSRDGVTPFCFQSKEFAVELQHVQWRSDQYDPNYKPKPGDLIWRDATQEDKELWFEQKKEMLRGINDPKMIEMAAHVLKTYEDNPQIFFAEIRDGEPVLDLVK